MPRIAWESQSMYEDLRTTQCHYCGTDSRDLTADYTPPVTMVHNGLYGAKDYAPKCAVNTCKACRSQIARTLRTKRNALGHSEFFLTMDEKHEAIKGYAPRTKHEDTSHSPAIRSSINGIVHSIWGFMAPSGLIQVSPGTFYLNDEPWTLDDVHRCQGLWALMFAKAPIEAIKSYVSVQGGFEPKHLSILNHEGINK